MIQTFVIFGRQPKLGLAELESLYGKDAIEPVGHVAAIVHKDPAEINFAALGGTIKFGKLLTVLETTRWGDIEQFLFKAIPEHARHLEPGKLRLGLSAYELHVTPKNLMATGLKIKKGLKTDGRSARLVPNTMPMLNSAQVLHNHLTGPLGWELLFVRHKDKTYIGQSIAVQDIEAYGARDHGRPMRDAKVGMLPPKLAQMIINLAKPKPGSTVLDPFCGTGVVLQEALLMGHDVYGTDLEPRMIAYSQANLDWLKQTRYYQHVCGPETRQGTIKLDVGNACERHWEKFDAIACETYLGRPFSALPKPEILKEVMQDVDTITKKFLKNVASQTKPGFRMCIAVPAWSDGKSFWHLSTLDHLEELGYTRAVFAHAEVDDLIYHREGQIVGRELVVITRK